jgi:hypothetical protein
MSYNQQLQTYQWNPLEQNNPNDVCESPKTNNIKSENISAEILNELNITINQSIVLAEDILVKNRPFRLLNKRILFNDHEIDMYDYLIRDDNLLPGEYSMVAHADNYDIWFARKTETNLLQYYHLTIDDSYDFPPNFLFSLFIKNYKERKHP